MDAKVVETNKDACKKIARECTAVRMRLINRVITSVYDDALRRLGLTVNQLNLLVAVCRMERVNAKQVGRVLQMDASTLSRNLDRMRKEGWLRLVAGEDARSRNLKITAKGERLMVKAFPAWEEAQKRVSVLLGAENVEAIEKMASGIWSGSQ